MITGKAKIDITIAGKQKEYQTCINVRADHELKVNGVLDLDITHFDLKSPKKLLGLVKLDKNIKIIFELFIKIL
ncbi:hypothetical protein [Aquimarina celericrescens]|uniref:Lipid/polyisoprenoid-binding YceI-like domain-containing protein n=1 Tax=Aquimarina celericrescens TaxID=1964542 RepID=A0ABW5ATE8_9FLAO|nr:hypothetical protein [Aquimarina celericrescens]